MSILPIFDIIGSIVSSILPNTTEIEKAKIAEAMATNADLTALLTGQMQINEAEANSGSIFVGGWRSAVGWVCAAAFAWEFVLQPILLFISASFHYNIVVPNFDFSTMSTVLMGMLGLGGLKTFEKIQTKSK